ncbi:MAG: divalent-cation tolerance protein CutA [Acidobacteria bacterium]|nr:divalent-cation tolerance protein CutA [Acidobacteriota bacterium]
MTDKIIVLMTGKNVRECKRLAQHLLEKRLIACANLVPVNSLYHWKGRVEEQKEYLMVLKSTRELFSALRMEVEKLHTYSVPEVIALPIVDGAPNYLNWIAETVAASQP